ncbi:MAG: DUF5615 family PIN-like protein [Halobacteria archaeon]
MVFSLVLDENVEYEVLHRLENYGHDVKHVDLVSELGKGTDDYSIGEYSLNEDRIIVTYDDDFVLDADEKDYRAVLYIHDATLTVKEVADIIHSISEVYPQEEVKGVEYLSGDWLDI